MQRTSEGTLRAIAFFGGGTGGHLFPGVAVAERARERFPGCRSVFFRTRRRVEDRVLGASGFPTRVVDLPVPAGGPASWFRYSLQSMRAIREIREALATDDFDAAFGLGGYASLPGILAARQVGIPVVLLEQNLVPGKVNRFLAPFVSAVSCPSDAAAERLRGRREITGNPVRRTVLEAAFQRQRWHWAGAVSSRRRQVLVVGGSQGASGVNRSIIASLPGLESYRERIAWVHITGERDREAVQEGYQQLGWEARVFAYVEDLPALMAASDIVIARAGGTTLAELSVLGVPAILVPYPHHRDQHQLRNAQRLVSAGGACILSEEEIDAEAIARLFEGLLFAPERLLAMEDGARSLARPDAADAVLDLVLELRRACP